MYIISIERVCPIIDFSQIKENKAGVENGVFLVFYAFFQFSEESFFQKANDATGPNFIYGGNNKWKKLFPAACARAAMTAATPDTMHPIKSLWPIDQH